MRTSQYLLSSQGETPADAEVISHQPMLRAGMIRKLASGLYLAADRRARSEKSRKHRAEDEQRRCDRVLMPVVQPSELWQGGVEDSIGPNAAYC